VCLGRSIVIVVINIVTLFGATWSNATTSGNPPFATMWAASLC
jgi:hypothetical protein